MQIFGGAFNTMNLRVLGVAICLLAMTSNSHGQSCPDDIRGGWEGVLSSKKLFEIEISVRTDEDGSYSGGLKTSGGDERLVVWRDGESLRMQSNVLPLAFDGRPSADGTQIIGFIDYSSNLYRVTLTATNEMSWSTSWSPLPVTTDSVKLDLYFDDDGAGGVAGYFFFRDERFPGLYGLGTSCDANKVRVGEKNLGLIFDGEFDANFERLEMVVTGSSDAVDILFVPMSAERLNMRPGAPERPPRTLSESGYSDRAPERTTDGWRTSKPSAAGADVGPLHSMIDAVASGDLPLTHSILIARSGELIVEEYFYGYDRDTLHDMRSASKSIASTLIGLAADRGMIKGSSATVLPYFPEYRSYESWHPAKAAIRIRDLLTMSSGLDANDSDPESVAAEGAYQSQSRQPDWVKLSLDAPMVSEPGTHLIYGSANPLILGGILDNVVGGRVEWFAETSLFAPLGIENYRIYMDPTGVPYMGGGVHLRPRDMLKYGQMYLDGGRWQGQRVLSEGWVEESFGKYGRIEPLDRNGNEYGYLWWHEMYEISGSSVASIEARGNGGQYIFVVPELELVAVITSGNYRGGLSMTRQPQRIFKQYILPAFN